MIIRAYRSRHKSRASSECTSEPGFVAIEFVLGMALLLLPVALLVIMLPTLFERQSMARVAAREASREYVLTNNAAQAQAMVDQILTHYHLPDKSLTLQLTGDPTKPGNSVTATVTARVPVTTIGPLNFTAPGFNITESHTELVDLYRSSLR